MCKPRDEIPGIQDDKRVVPLRVTNQGAEFLVHKLGRCKRTEYFESENAPICCIPSSKEDSIFQHLLLNVSIHACKL